MRTILWFLYFWLYLLAKLPQYFTVKRAIAQGRKAEVADRVERIVQSWASHLLKAAGVTVEVHGTENIPDEAALFVANHQGNFDIPIVICHLGRLKPIVAKKELQKIPGIRAWMSFFDCIFMDRGNPRQSLTCLNAAQSYLSEGRSVIIFPEGTRSKGDTMNEFKAGALRCAVKAQAPVVPCVIDGSYRAMEANGNRIRPATVRLTILPPVPTKDMEKEKTKRISEDVQVMIASHLKGNEQWTNA